MKAVVYFSNGAPSVLECAELERPVPADNQVLIKVRAASINPVDCAELKGMPALVRLMFGLQKPNPSRPGRLGIDVAGLVEAVGAKVTEFRPGDAVFGACVNNPHAPGTNVWLHRQGTFAEYASAPEAALVLKPENVSFEDAASLPIAALTALQGLRDKGHVQPGQKVLVHGAGGGVGTFAVQIARALGAHVTAVSSPNNLAALRAIGADRVIDYTAEDFTQNDDRYDVILDCYGNHSLISCRRVLGPRGIYVAVGGPGGLGILARLLGMLVLSWFGSRKMTTFLARPRKRDLAVIAGFIASGHLKPVIDSRYPLDAVPEAIRHLSEPHAGKIVITV